MRILVVVHGFPPHEEGGTEVYTQGLAEALAEQGHEVAVFSGHQSAGGRVHEIERQGRVQVERFRAGPPRQEALVWSEDPEVERVFLEALERVRPDVVHVQSLLFLSSSLPRAARAWDVPVVLSLSDFWFLCPRIHLPLSASHPLRGRLWGLSCFRHCDLPSARALASLARRRELLPRLRGHLARPGTMRKTLEAADVLVVPSRFVRDRFVEFGVDPGRVVVVPYGMAPLDIPAKPLRRPEGIHFGFLGALLEAKGADLLVRAFSRVRAPHARLTVRGVEPDPSYVKALRELAQADARITMGGPLSRPEIGAFLSELDALVVPTRLHETFSLVAREGFMAGVPVIAADAGALAELVIDGRNGLLFRAGSEDDLASRLQFVADRPAELRRLRNFPRQTTMGEHARELATLYCQLSREPGAVRAAN